MCRLRWFLPEPWLCGIFGLWCNRCSFLSTLNISLAVTHLHRLWYTHTLKPTPLTHHHTSSLLQGPLICKDTVCRFRFRLCPAPVLVEEYSVVLTRPMLSQSLIKTKGNDKYFRTDKENILKCSFFLWQFSVVFSVLKRPGKSSVH